MLVDNDVYINKYVADGSTTSFPIAFPFLEASHIEVYTRGEDGEDILVDPNTYTITGAGVEAGGELTFNIAPVAGTVIAIIRNVPITQLYAYTELDNFPAESHENALAKLTMIDQQQAEILGRAVTVPITSDKTSDQWISDFISSMGQAVDTAQTAATTAVDSASDAADILAEVKEIADSVIVEVNNELSSVTMTINTNVAANTVITLPHDENDKQLIYTVGSHSLMMFYNGSVMFRGAQYNEIGNNGDRASTIRLLQDLRAGDVLMIQILGLNVSSLVDNDTILWDENIGMHVNTEGVIDNYDQEIRDRIAEVIDEEGFVSQDGLASTLQAYQPINTEEWESTVDYAQGAIVKGSDGNVYIALVASGYTTEDAVDPVGDTSGTWDKITTDVDVVKLTGAQTIAGKKTFSDTITITNDNYSINRSNTTGALRLCGGTDNGGTTGAFLALFGAGSSSASYFRLASGSRWFEGHPDGTLTWDGKAFVYTSGDQEIDGTKTFKKDTFLTKNTPILVLKNSDTSGYSDIRFQDNNGTNQAIIRFNYNGSWSIGRAYTNAWDGAGIEINKDGSINLHANQNGTAKYLNCKYDGTLTWDGGFYSKVGNTPSFTGISSSYTWNSSTPSSSVYTGLWANDKDKTQFGGLNIQHSSSGNAFVEFNVSPINKAKSILSVRLYENSGDTIRAFRPQSTNDITLGNSGNVWKQLFAGTTTISTSDERVKSNIASIPDEVLDAWSEVNWWQFQFNDSIEEKGEENARFHSGLVAQRIDEVFRQHNLDVSRYGLFCHDQWDAEPEDVDEDGRVLTQAKEAGDAYAIRYEEALCMEAAYQRRRADRAEARIASLEQRLYELESVLAVLGGNND